jgi:hypothetical protein
MSDFENLNVKLSETDIIFLLILNVLDWNIIICHVFYIMFF